MMPEAALGQEPAGGPYDENQGLSQNQFQYQTTIGGHATQTGRGPANKNQEGLRP